MTKSWMRRLLAILTFSVVLGAGISVRQLSVHAQAAGMSSTPEAQSPQKNEQEQDENDAYRKSPAVVALGAKLGLTPDQSATAFWAANFFVLAVSIGWVIAKMLPKMLRARNTSIQKQIVDARSATEEARGRLGSVEERLARLDGEIAALRSHAEQEWAQEEQRIRGAVESEKQKILASADQEIAAATMHAQKLLQQHAAELAIEQAARKLVVTAETDRLLVQGFAQRLTGDESKKGQN